MSDTNGNGERKRFEAIAKNINLQAWSRLSMVSGPPIIAVIVAVAAWFLGGLSSDVRELRKDLSGYITVDSIAGEKAASKIAEHERRLGNIEGKVFGFSPIPRNGATP